MVRTRRWPGCSTRTPQNAETLRLAQTADRRRGPGAARLAVVPKDVEAWSVRWAFPHVISELARHAGHADIIRESIDGATMYELIAAVEHWEPQPWLTPWSPKRERPPPKALR